MERLPRKKTWCIISLITFVIVNAPMIMSLSHAQKAPVTGKAMTVLLYETGGRLTTVNLKEKRAVIDDRTWELSENFNTKGLPPRWIKQGSYECKNGWIVVRYYISLRIRSEEASLLDIGEKPAGKSKVREVTNAEEVQELLEKGGQIYRIEVMPA